MGATWTSRRQGFSGSQPGVMPTAPASRGNLRFCDVTEPRRVLIDWVWTASGIWWVLTKEEMETPAPTGHWSGTPKPKSERKRPWSDLLSEPLLDDLKEWNDAWDAKDADSVLLEARGRDLAERVQAELGTDGWEVLYKSRGRVHRVEPPGSWPAASWQEELLGYAPRKRGADER